MRQTKLSAAFTGLTAILSATLALSACSGDVYDAKKHEQIIHYLSPVDSVDQHHTWKLTTNQTFAFTANASGVEAQRLQVFTENPLSSRSAELMGESAISNGETVSLTLSIPTRYSQLYAALIDTDGLYTISSFSLRGQKADFSSPVATRVSLPYTPKPQTYTYCFEENYPEPGDYDFNDAVLRIQMERKGDNAVALHVTLAAVGADTQLAGAIRLVGFKYDEIDSVTTDLGLTYNEGAPQLSHNLIESDDNLLKGRKGEAVINLFVDAHWAMGENLETSYGMFQRKKYNVSTGSGGGYQQIVTRTRTYNIYFKDPVVIRGFTLDSLDPFVLVEYNGAKWEIHTDEFADAMTFYEYNILSFKDLPWALKIPLGDFRYPLEGCEIGFRKRLDDGTTAMYGAYMKEGHSFGQWTEDHTNYLDWYLPQYANTEMVW